MPENARSQRTQHSTTHRYGRKGNGAGCRSQLPLDTGYKFSRDALCSTVCRRLVPHSWYTHSTVCAQNVRKKKTGKNACNSDGAIEWDRRRQILLTNSRRAHSHPPSLPHSHSSRLSPSPALQPKPYAPCSALHKITDFSPQPCSTEFNLIKRFEAGA